MLNLRHGAIKAGVLRFLHLLGITTYAEDHADVSTVDKRGSTATADKWQWLTRNGEQSRSYQHIEYSL